MRMAFTEVLESNKPLPGLKLAVSSLLKTLKWNIGICQLVSTPLKSCIRAPGELLGNSCVSISNSLNKYRHNIIRPKIKF